MVFTIYGHGGHLEFRIMTHFSLVLYIHHINAKCEISFKFAQYFHRKCHSKFFMNGCHGNIFNIPMKNLAILYRKVPHMLHAKYQLNPPGGSEEEEF